MSTVIRPELSKRNKYWIERHRYYELKHFCLQYPKWRYICNSINPYPEAVLRELSGRTNHISDPVNDAVTYRQLYAERIELIKRVAQQTDPVLGSYILEGVTQGFSYETLRARTGVPCGKDIYYELYRKFFWLLDQERS